MIKIFKKNKKIIFSFILGLLFFSCITVSASTILSAVNITYSSESTTKTDTHNALEELYSLAEEKVEEATSSCPDGYRCISKTDYFELDEWSTIASKVRSGDYPYQVGDTKTIDMGELGVHTLRISNTSACTNGETSETACGFVVEFADIITTHKMNDSPTNIGGWENSKLRTYVNETIYDSLPSDLQNIILTTTVISGHGTTEGETNFQTSDKLYLFNEQEVWGDNRTGDTSFETSKQLDYYASLGVTEFDYTTSYRTLKKYNNTNYSWWLRSAYSKYNGSFLYVDNTGERVCGFGGATNEIGVSPAFRIG